VQADFGPRNHLPGDQVRCDEFLCNVVCHGELPYSIAVPAGIRRCELASGACHWYQGRPLVAPGLAFSKRMDVRRTGKMDREDGALAQARYREGKVDFPRLRCARLISCVASRMDSEKPHNRERAYRAERFYFDLVGSCFEAPCPLVEDFFCSGGSTFREVGASFDISVGSHQK
jgi:hypothetical protein